MGTTLLRVLAVSAILLLMALSANTVRAATIYVNETGAGSGTSWADATPDLQAALAAAVAGDQIWVAGPAVYKTDPGADRNASFQLKEGVEMYGAFPNTGDPGLGDRNTLFYATILSGDIGVGGNDADNSYHVVRADATITTATVLDGFNIADGNANGGPFLSGGGLLSEGTPTIRDCLFFDNRADTAGGAIYYSGSDLLTLTNCDFSNNTAGVNGGAIGALGEVEIDGGDFTANTATNGGGAIWIGGDKALRIFSSGFPVFFNGNQATNGNGGAILLEPTAAITVSIDNTVFSGSDAMGTFPNGSGGAVFFDGLTSQLTVSNSAFSANTANDRASAIHSNGDLDVSLSTFNSNACTSGPGTIYSETGGDLFVDTCTFDGNSALSGGAIFNVTGPLAVSDTTFNGNNATANHGGAIFNSSTTFVVARSTFSGNTANQDGGAIFNPGGTITDATFSGNTADTGGAISAQQNFRVERSVFSDNEATTAGGGILVAANTLDLKNTIIANSVGGDLTLSGGTLGENLGNLIEDGSYPPALSGDPSLGPLQDNGGSTQTHALLAGSIAIDAGDPAFTGPPDVDQRGLPRVVNCRVDIGPLEYQFAPDIEVFNGGTPINVNDSVDFGVTPLNVPVSLVVTINNTGNDTLELDAPSVTGDFSTPAAVGTSILPANTWSFTVEMDVTAFGPKTGTVTLTSNDLCDSPFTFTVQGRVNTPPVAGDDNYFIAQDGTLTIAQPGVMSNDSDADGDPLEAFNVTDPSNGVLTAFNTDGSFTYIPNGGFSGVDGFTYAVSDGTEPSGTAFVTITVTPPNTPPAAVDDAYTVAEDGNLNVTAATGLLANDADAEMQPLTVETIVSGPTHGTLGNMADGAFTYTPDPDFNGTDSFAYTASDGIAPSNTAFVTIIVTPVNDLPVANDDTNFAIDEGGELNISDGSRILGNDVDVDGDPLTAVKVSDPANGTLTLNADGSFRYVPTPDFNGVASFTYRADDGTAQSAPAFVAITVRAVNDPPNAVNNAYTTPEETPLSVPAPGVLGNDTDVEGQVLAASVVDPPNNGTLVLNPDGAFTYTPSANYAGTDTFTYRATDLDGASDTATVQITVSNINDPPVAVADAYETDEDTPLTVAAPGVLGNDTDVEDAVLIAERLSGPSSGRLELDPNGGFTYTPNANFNGTDTFEYIASDGTGDSAPTVVTITITPVNDAPAARDDAFGVAPNTPFSRPAPGILENDTDVEDDTLTATLATPPANGTVEVGGDGAFTYTPDADFSGADTFTYTAADSDGGSAEATVTLNVGPLNQPPVALADDYVLEEDGSLSVDAPGLLENDTDPEGDEMRADLLDGPATGELIFNEDGGFVYTPAPNYAGETTFTYQALDDFGKSEVVTVTLLVNAVADPPEIRSLDGDTVDYAETDGPRPIDVDANAMVIDPDSENLNGGFLRVGNPKGAPGDAILIGFDMGGDADGDGDPDTGIFPTADGGILFNGAEIGIVDPEADGTDGAPFRALFTSEAATPEAASALIRALRFQNTGVSPGSLWTAGERRLEISVSDGEAESAPSTVTINLTPTEHPGILWTLAITIIPNNGGTVSGEGLDCPGHLIEATCSGDYPAGASVTLTAFADDGFAFDRWEGVEDGGTDTVTVEMTGDIAVTLFFRNVTPEDLCPNDPNKTAPGICGCGAPDIDSDGDGVPDCLESCPFDPNKTDPGACGCGVPDIDTDGDGTPDCADGCPEDPGKTDPGVCGCGVPDVDPDGDGAADCDDLCPDDPEKAAPGDCGCGVPDTDFDGDGTPDCDDPCPEDPAKTEPGVCGCGAPDVDADGDGTFECDDLCPDDPEKSEPGFCGCGVPDIDTDGDNTPDCNDGCPDDPLKTVPAACGCGVPDIDTDGDGAPDCVDRCPDDPGKTDPGACGCGLPETGGCLPNRPPAQPQPLSPANRTILPPGPVTVTATPATDPEGDPISRTLVQVRPAGSEPWQVVADIPGAQTEVTVDDLPPGIEYEWRVGIEDEGSEIVTWSPVSVFVIGDETVLEIIDVPVSRIQPDYVPVALSLWPPDQKLRNVLTGIMGPALDRDNYRIAVYLPGRGYVEYGEADFRVRPGHAIWFFALNGLSAGVEGVPVTLEEDMERALDFDPATGDGWNFISPPNGADYSWEEVLVVFRAPDAENAAPTRIGDLSNPNDLIDLRLWRWEGGAYPADTGIMRRRTGHWVRAKQPHVALIFPVSAQLPDETGAERRRRSVVAESWDSPPVPQSAIAGGEPDGLNSGAGGCFLNALP